MQWISKHAPLYVFMCDTWKRETDGKIFSPKEGYWLAMDGEKVDWPPKSKKMQYGSDGMDKR